MIILVVNLVCFMLASYSFFKTGINHSSIVLGWFNCVISLLMAIQTVVTGIDIAQLVGVL